VKHSEDAAEKKRLRQEADQRSRLIADAISLFDQRMPASAALQRDTASL
jgi:hypothetical protein